MRIPGGHADSVFVRSVTSCYNSNCIVFTASFLQTITSNKSILGQTCFATLDRFSSRALLATLKIYCSKCWCSSLCITNSRINRFTFLHILLLCYSILSLRIMPCVSSDPDISSNPPKCTDDPCFVQNSVSSNTSCDNLTINFTDDFIKQICAKGSNASDRVKQLHLARHMWCPNLPILFILPSLDPPAKPHSMANGSSVCDLFIPFVADNVCEKNLKQALNDIEKKMKEITDPFNELLNRSFCTKRDDPEYYVTGQFHCEECEKAYYTWACAVSLQWYFPHKSVDNSSLLFLCLNPTKQCDDFCKEVETMCPYWNPHAKSSNGGEPAFKCHNKLDDEGIEEDQCKQSCFNKANAIGFLNESVIPWSKTTEQQSRDIVSRPPLFNNSSSSSSLSNFYSTPSNLMCIYVLLFLSHYFYLTTI